MRVSLHFHRWWNPSLWTFTGELQFFGQSSRGCMWMLTFPILGKWFLVLQKLFTGQIYKVLDLVTILFQERHNVCGDKLGFNVNTRLPGCLYNVFLFLQIIHSWEEAFTLNNLGKVPQVLNMEIYFLWSNNIILNILDLLCLIDIWFSQWKYVLKLILPLDKSPRMWWDFISWGQHIFILVLYFF